jgi:hypothetical protein
MWNFPLRCLKAMLYSILLANVFCYAAGTDAASDIALSARVVNPEVTYTISNATRGYTPREDAVIALRAGDTLATARYGRAYLRFVDTVEILLLPNSSLEIIASRVDEADEYLLRMRLVGNAVVRFIDASSASVLLELIANQSTIRTRQGWFSFWSDFESSDVVTVASGNIAVSTYFGDELVSAAEGLRINLSGVHKAAMDAPYNGARLIGEVVGCEGRVRSLLPNLNIRAGTSLGYAEIGFVNNNALLRIVGRTADGVWYRIQRFSGFGWVLASAVETTCVPPLYPNLYGENNRELFDVEGIELLMLNPFYGTFESDPWFYRWLETTAP